MRRVRWIFAREETMEGKIRRLSRKPEPSLNQLAVNYGGDHLGCQLMLKLPLVAPELGLPLIEIPIDVLGLKLFDKLPVKL
jgi:hypothetical protein